MSEEQMVMRVHGTADLPTLVYLPGIHGDWTLIGGFRKALQGKVRFVEFTYPRTLTWSLQDYADAAEQALLRHGIARAWVLAESFGSQIVWPMAQGEGFKPEGVILAGGFGQHPTRWGVIGAERFCRYVPLSLCASSCDSTDLLRNGDFTATRKFLATLRSLLLAAPKRTGKRRCTVSD